MLAPATREFGGISGLSGQANSAPPTPTPVTINDRIVNSLTLANEMRERLEILNRALRGSRPSPAEVNKVPKDAETSMKIAVNLLYSVLLEINGEITEAYGALGI